MYCLFGSIRSNNAWRVYRFATLHTDRDKTHTRCTINVCKMDTLPVELVDLVLQGTGMLVWPILRRVCAQWHSLLERRRKIKRFHENRPYKRRCFMPAVHTHHCTLPSRCTTFYMSRLVDAGHWTLLDWMVATHCSVWSKPGAGYAQQYLCTQLAAHGDLVRLRAMVETHKFRMDADACPNAARCGHLETVQWAYSINSKSTRIGGTRAWAAYGGHLDIVQWTHKLSSIDAGEACRMPPKQDSWMS